MDKVIINQADEIYLKGILSALEGKSVETRISFNRGFEVLFVDRKWLFKEVSMQTVHHDEFEGKLNFKMYEDNGKSYVCEFSIRGNDIGVIDISDTIDTSVEVRIEIMKRLELFKNNFYMFCYVYNNYKDFQNVESKLDP